MFAFPISSGVANKANFIRFLSNKLTILGIRIVQVPCEADISIVQEAIMPVICKESVNNVIVMHDVTDILCLLVHYCSNFPVSIEISLKNVACQHNQPNDNEQNHVPNVRKQHDLQKILDDMEEITKLFI